MKPVPPVTSVFAIGGHGRTVAVSASTRPALVTDTTSYLPPEVLERHDVHLVSLYVGLEGDQQREIELLDDLDGFYERLRASEEAVTTSQPSVGDFIAVYEPLLAEGREIVSIHISAGHLGHLRDRDAGARPPHRRGQGRRADPRGRLEDGRRRHGAGRCSGRPAPPRRARSAEEVAARAEEARGRT